jgi:hypothetical protein
VDKTHYMTWEQIKALHEQGFEIGNHTRKHAGVTKQKPEQLAADVEFIETQMRGAWHSEAGELLLSRLCNERGGGEAAA